MTWHDRTWRDRTWDGLKRLWRLIPRPVRHGAFGAYARLRGRSVKGRRVRRLRDAARRKRFDIPAARGRCAVVGLFRSRSGLGRAAWLNAMALSQAGYDVELFDYNSATRTTSLYTTMPAPGGAAALPDLLLVHLNPPLSSDALDAYLQTRSEPRRWVAFWVWETQGAPAGWLRDSGLFDEIWTPSRFAEAAFEGCQAPLRLMPHPCAIDPPGALGDRATARADLGLPQAAFVVAFSFDMRSSFARKNPLGLIEAFRRAFDGDALKRLVVRVGSKDMYPAGMAALIEAAGGDETIRLLDGETDIKALYAACDVYASLHRSEGFGMTLPEAMLHARPVVATGWSGNLEYMDADTALLIPFRLTPIVDPQQTYSPDHVWADPDLDAAAEALRRLAADRPWAEALGLRGREHVLQTLSGLPPFQADDVAPPRSDRPAARGEALARA